MGFNIPSPSAGAGAPEVEDGLAIVRFEDIRERFVEDFVTEKDNYGKPDDGHRLDFIFTLLTADHEVVYEEGDPVELRQAKACKPGSTGPKSNFREVLSGILTPKELAAWEASTPEDPFDGSAIQGRILNVKISHNKRGWPEVETVIGPVKGAK